MASDVIPPHTGLATRHGGGADARAFWLVCALLSVILLVPFVAFEYPGMPDYLNHLARAQVIVDAELHGTVSPYYEVRHVLMANMALDSIVPLLVAAGLTTNTALRIFTAVALLLPIAGVVAVGWVVLRRTPWLALLAFPLAYTRYFVWGFSNYFFGVGLALLGYALYMRLRRQPATGYHLALAIAALLFGAATMLSHLMGFGIFVLLVASFELALGVAAWRRSGGAGLWRSTALGLLPALTALTVCLVFYAVAFEHGGTTTVVWQDTAPIAKLRGVLSPFLSYRTAPGLIVAAIALAVMVGLLALRRAALAPGWAYPVAVFVVCFALLPSQAMGSYFLSSRLLPIAWLAWFAFAGLTVPTTPTVKTGVIVAALVMTCIKTAEVSSQWRHSSAQTAAIRRAVDATVPDQGMVNTVIYADKSETTQLVPLNHAAAFAVMDKHGYMPDIFAFPFNGEAIALRPDLVEATRTDKAAQIFNRSADVPWSRFCTHFDVAIVVNLKGTPEPPPPCGTLVARGDGFELYRLRTRPAD